MSENEGLRERKKRRTRVALIDAGLQLFDERGFEATTVADICAAADVAPATFYKHFPTKEDLVFANQPYRLEVFRDLVRDREPGAPIDEHLTRVIDRGLKHPDLPLVSENVRPVRRRLIMETPALRAIALRWLFDSQEELGAALAEAYPDELDELTARAVIGALLGAMISTSRAASARGLTSAEAAKFAAQVVLSGLADPTRIPRPPS
ncbi:TetR/AcrR family transcriptional regulator [Spiractinospora alimapuensis]|uniref:TetR/AcrR family transcriptional regulator n=1 Tax=Spiractinospora alimapuensis TaxID=2820884 RepID=UPI001F3B53C2|nr:TetR/AcrR family transcriptional regulator [Spiractinospora alimapuensis]QVQ52460.1 TetR/AcrR family transcriptional regulator [Spiractinospora alimapuensis]